MYKPFYNYIMYSRNNIVFVCVCFFGCIWWCKRWTSEY